MTQIDYRKLSADELRGLMRNALRLGDQAVHRAALERLSELSPDADLSAEDMGDVLTQRFWQAVTAAEQIRSEANGKTTRLQRTRNKARDHGIVATMADLAKKKDPSDGFHYLVEAELPHLVFEYVIAELPDRFDSETLAAAHSRLDAFGIARPPAGVR